MRRSALLATVILVAATLFGGSEQVTLSQEPVLVIHGGRLFDGTGAAAIEEGVVVIEGNRIVAAGRADEVAVPAQAARINAAGGLIMPGVIDNHVHVTAPLAQRQDILTPWLRAGVTALVDTGTVRNGVDALRGQVDAVAVAPPRVFVAGPILTAPDGYPATRSEPFSELSAQGVTSPEDATERVADLIDRQGADLIKVAIETGFGSDYDDAGWPVLDAETLAAIATAAHERGRTVRAHVTQEGELRAALEAGFDGAAHTPLEPLSDEILQAAADAGMIFVSTANIWGSAAGPIIADNLARYAALGGRVALGTDFPFQAGSNMPVKEMQVLVDGGLTPAEVLVAATKHGGEALGLGDELGTLEPGKLADVIVVAGDPLSDIADMANVTVVVRDGELIVGTTEGSGDVNSDGLVNSIDAALVLQHVAALLPSLPDMAGADVNGDGTVDSIDAALILQREAGLLGAVMPSRRGPGALGAPDRAAAGSG